MTKLHIVFNFGVSKGLLLHFQRQVATLLCPLCTRSVWMAVSLRTLRLGMLSCTKMEFLSWYLADP